MSISYWRRQNVGDGHGPGFKRSFTNGLAADWDRSDLV